jgi:hypothetical protein
MLGANGSLVVTIKQSTKYGFHGAGMLSYIALPSSQSWVDPLWHDVHIKFRGNCSVD